MRALQTEIDTFLAKVAHAPHVELTRPFEGTARFELRSELGSGAFGEVYEARDRDYGSRVALKVLKCDAPDSLFRFKREFRTVVDISHANLVRLYELQQYESHWVLTMELIDGIAFDEYLRRSPKDLRSCFAQLAEGIATLHQAGVLHRDIKPSNILVERTGRVVLMDFGLVSDTAFVDASVVAGTPHYMAPEQLKGEACAASDWFAFGIMLYETLSKRSPFAGVDRKSRLVSPPPCSATSSEFESLAALADRILEPNANNRPSAADILSTLQSHEKGVATAPEDIRFVGRISELATLEHALTQAQHTPTLVSIFGAPRMGKTCLAREFLTSVRKRGIRVYEGRCHEAESLPFKGLDGLVDMLCEELLVRRELAVTLPSDDGALTRMFPVLKRVDAFCVSHTSAPARSPQELRTAAFEGLRAILAQLARKAPLVLFLDDLQWAEEDSLELLAALLREPAPNMLVVATARTPEPGQTQRLALFRTEMAQRQHLQSTDIFLAGLDMRSVDTLLAHHGMQSLSASQLHQDSAGHPFLIARMLQSGATAVAPDITSVLAAEFSHLTPDALQLLRFVCMSAAPLSQLDACRLAGVTSGSSSHIDSLRRARLIRTHDIAPGSEIKPYHDRVREALVGSQASEMQVALHSELARYLEANSLAGADAIATHYAASGQRAQTRIWAHKAAKEASKTLAYARAAEWYEKATEACDTAALAVTLHEEWARAVAALGRSVEAGHLFLAAVEHATSCGDRETANHLLAQAGEHLMLGGELALGCDVIVKALEEYGVDLPSDKYVAVAQAFNLGASLAARGLEHRFLPPEEIDADQATLVDVESGAARALGFTDMRAPYLGALCLTHALELGDPRRLQRALCYFVLTNAVTAPSHELFWDAIDKAFSLANGEVELGWAYLIRGLTSQYNGDVLSCLPDFKAAERIFWRADPPMLREASAMRILIMFCCIGDGVDLPYAIETCDKWISEADARRDVYAGNFIRLAGSWMQLSQGDVTGAKECLDTLAGQWTDVDDDIFWASMRSYRIGIELYDNPGNAFTLAQEVEPEFQKRFVSMLPLHQGTFHTMRGHAAAAAFVNGDADAAITRTRLEESIETLEAVRYWCWSKHGLRGHHAFTCGDKLGAAKHFGAAAEEWRRETQHVFAHSALLRRAEVLRDAKAAETERDALRAHGVVDPDRYSVLFAGPSLAPR